MASPPSTKMTKLPKVLPLPVSGIKERPKVTNRTASSSLPVTTDADSVIAKKECAVKPLAPLSIIDWAWSTKTYTIALPLPLCNDTLPVLEKKLGLLRNVVESGESLARATSWQAADSKDDLAYQWVRQNLTPLEFSRFVAWTEGIPAPSVDWTKVKEEDGQRDSKAIQCLIDVLGPLYPECNITHREGVWFAKTYPDDVPFMTAIGKVKEAGLIFVSAEALWTSPEQAETQTARRIVAAAKASLEAAQDDVEPLKRSIRRSIRFISTREGALEGEVIALEKRLRSGVAKKNAV